jgi:hypothetical protein
MNMLKVCNSTEFVNYVKPEVAMIEMEIEGNLLLTASGLDFDQKDPELEGPGDGGGGDFRRSRPRVKR